jgi:hypothetical protein
LFYKPSEQQVPMYTLHKKSSRQAHARTARVAVERCTGSRLKLQPQVTPKGESQQTPQDLAVGLTHTSFMVPTSVMSGAVDLDSTPSANVPPHCTLWPDRCCCCCCCCRF